ncbi:MAG: type transport system ATP-binding protein [Actinomycetota bacterium]|nr:type transport system ATP-binding protein [Actinomycetota bacterium]
MLTLSSASRRARRAVIVTVALLTFSSACTTSAKSAGPPATTRGTVPPAPQCRPPATGAVHAVAVAGVPGDWVITSFDGAQIRVHWFPLRDAAGPRVPTVLMGPGWGLGGDTGTTSTGLYGTLSIKGLRTAGYNVVTWDPRGFGQSTGTVEVDSAGAEERDVARVIDWVATRPGVELDGARDPRVGMVGASYGGGIQIVTAAIDCRVDAIVPSWAWHSLTTSLYKAQTAKIGWSRLLYSVASSRQLDPHIHSAYTSATAAGVIDSADQAWFASRGPGSGLVNRIRVPTLFVQGTVDTLFTLDEAVTNYRILRANGVPTAMIWFCGGHGVCLTAPGDGQRVEQRTMLWLSRYLKRDQAVDTGPGFEMVDQNGKSYTADHYPLDAAAPIIADGHGTLTLTPAGGAGPAHPRPDNPDLLAGIVAPFTPAKAANAVDVNVAFGGGSGAQASMVVGAPQLRLTYRGTVKAGRRPSRVFAQLVEPKTGLVLGNQITPIDVTLDGREHTITVPLEMVAYRAEPGGSLLLQLVATTVAYSQPRLDGSIEMSAHLVLPVVTNLVARS